MQCTLTLREEGQWAELSPQGSKTTEGINHIGQPGWVTFPETQVLFHVEGAPQSQISRPVG